MRYYDAKSGWTDVEGTIENSIEELFRDGKTIITAVREGKHSRVIMGHCCGEAFVMVVSTAATAP